MRWFSNSSLKIGMEPTEGFEPSTYALRVRRSTPELHRRAVKNYTSNLSSLCGACPIISFQVQLGRYADQPTDYP